MVASATSHIFDVLLVEDNGAHAELVRRALDDHPIESRLHHVSDGKQALDYLFRHGDFSDPGSSPRPQVVLLDLRLPRVDGLEVLTRIRASEEIPDLPVVVLSTSSAERDVAMAYARHANSYLVKPADFESFQTLMDEFGSYWLGHNQPPPGYA
jgi:CheY-like chemotaxis protein